MQRTVSPVARCKANTCFPCTEALITTMKYKSTGIYHGYVNGVVSILPLSYCSVIAICTCAVRQLLSIRHVAVLPSTRGLRGEHGRNQIKLFVLCSEACALLASGVGTGAVFRA